MLLSLVFSGCATSGNSQNSSQPGSSEAASAQDTAEPVDTKTAYEGSTGSGLLMERYKSGQIEGYRD